MKYDIFGRAHGIVTRVLKHKKINRCVSFFQKNKLIVFALIIGGIGVDSLFIIKESDIAYFGLLGLYIVFTRVFQTKSSSTFLLCLGVIGVMFISLVFSQASVRTEKLTVWFFLLMVVGILQQWRE